MKITICVCGGISAYKSASIISALKKYKDIDIKVIMTKNATEFITPLTLETLSKNTVAIDMFSESNADYVGHIEYAQHTDLILVVPATANIIGKTANGIADDMVTSTIIAATAPVIFVPAMNEKMYLNKIVQANISKLKSYDYIFIEPEQGLLACGDVGIGKLPQTKTIIEEVLKYKEE